MGLSIHYSGQLKTGASIDDLVEEVKDICNVLDWHFQLIRDDKLKGIFFSAPECEPVFLTFNNEGHLCSPVLLEYDIHPATTISTKTQYAGMQVHRSIITLFRHLEEKYFSFFEMMDESGYWETNDDMIMEDQFNRYNALLGMVNSALKGFRMHEGETDEAMAERLQKFLKEKLSSEIGDDIIEGIEIVKVSRNQNEPGR